NTAVRHSVLDVVFDTQVGELSIRVIRNETYIKQGGRWYFIAGQGTKMLTEEEKKEMVEKAKKH
ncbi:MAG TPA: hypothetical protein VM871_11345, partial [Flavisolibacter sp.]|nr:hypothetical protein [Flavisolibacter sp.]